MTRHHSWGQGRTLGARSRRSTLGRLTNLAGGLAAVGGPLLAAMAPAVLRRARTSTGGGGGPSKKRRIEPSSTSVKAKPDPLGGSFSKYERQVCKPFNKAVMKGVGPAFYNVNAGQRLTSAYGKQNFGLIATAFDFASTTSLTTVIASAAAPKTGRYFIQRYEGDIMVTNMESMGCLYTIFDIECKHDGYSGSSTPLTTILADLVDPGGGGAATDALVPGVNWETHPRFTQYYKVMQRTVGSLQPGNTHIHHVNYNLNKLINMEYLTNSGTNSFMKGITYYTLIQFHGLPANDSTTKTTVTLSAVNLDVVTKGLFVGRQCYPPYQTETFTNSLVTTGLTLEGMNEFTEAPVVDNAA